MNMKTLSILFPALAACCLVTGQEVMTLVQDVLDEPYDLVVDLSTTNNLHYITDGVNQRVAVYNPSTGVLGDLTGMAFGSPHGIVVDPGHCSRKTFDQVTTLTTKPVTVLHATPANTKPGAGDLDDDQIRAVARTGGVIGIHFFSHYLHPTRQATADDVVDHIDYIAHLTGIHHVALGGDYLYLTDAFRENHGLPHPVQLQ